MRDNLLPYQRACFVTHLPLDYLYSADHFWLAQPSPGLWRIGLTKFGVRLMGELVDHGFKAASGAPVRLGQIIGWVEGFKAISDLHCLVEGFFNRGNAALREQLLLINHEPYSDGWLYEVKGQPDPQCVDVHGYQQILNKTIDRLNKPC